jgi:hypothetical protein
LQAFWSELLQDMPIAERKLTSYKTTVVDGIMAPFVRTYSLMQAPEHPEHHVLHFQDDYAHASLADVETPLAHSALLTQLKLQADGAMRLGGSGRLHVHKKTGTVEDKLVDKSVGYGDGMKMDEDEKTEDAKRKPAKTVPTRPSSLS